MVSIHLSDWIASTRVANLEALATLVTKDLAPRLRGGDSIALMGPLGAGKTTLMRYLVTHFGGIDSVSSPTYVLEHLYRCPGEYHGIVTIHHWDLYRLGEPPEELAESPSAREICCIEWADKFPEILEQCTVRVGLEYGSGPNERIVTVVGN